MKTARSFEQEFEKAGILQNQLKVISNISLLITPVNNIYTFSIII